MNQLIGICLFALCLTNQVKAQSKTIWEARLFFGTTVGHVQDNDGTPSAINKTSDGYTTNEGNQRSLSLGMNAILPMNETWAFSIGGAFTQRQLLLRNTDGSYSGVSKYLISYLQVPFMLRYTSKEVAKGLKIHVGAGPCLELKLSERLEGPDGAHYWNLAYNRKWLDPTRGQNGDNKEMKLFNPLDVSIMITGGVQYSLTEKLGLYGGIMVNPSLINMINPNLKFNDANKTPVSNDVQFRTTLVGVDLGFRF
jgi:hypothetical protein